MNESPNTTLNDFRQSLTTTEPPAGLTYALAGSWWDAKGDWTGRTNRLRGPEGSWVYAYLHRKEGDQDNAAYWYSRVGKYFAHAVIREMIRRSSLT